MSKGRWYGRPIEELTREELEDALLQMAEMYQAQGRQHSKDLGYLAPKSVTLPFKASHCVRAGQAIWQNGRVVGHIQSDLEAGETGTLILLG